MTAPILYFSDVLCGYCYVAEARIDQLNKDFGDSIQLSHHLISVFGDVHRRIASRGMTHEEYGVMIGNALQRYEHLEVHPKVFQNDPPRSSMPAHLYLRSVKLIEDLGLLPKTSETGSSLERMMRAVRIAYFRDLRDVSRREVLDEIAGELDVPAPLVAARIDDGSAFAELARDGALQKKHGVTMTPSFVLGSDHQILHGNVGYRVIEAVVRELVNQRSAPHTWC